MVATAMVSSLTGSSEIIGRAEYKSHEYLMVWEGETKRGPAAKLAFRDGSKVFWASAGDYRIVRRYREPMTLRALDRFAAEKKAEREANERARASPASALSAHLSRSRRIDRLRAHALRH